MAYYVHHKYDTELGKNYFAKSWKNQSVFGAISELLMIRARWHNMVHGDVLGDSGIAPLRDVLKSTRLSTVEVFRLCLISIQ